MKIKLLLSLMCTILFFTNVSANGVGSTSELGTVCGGQGQPMCDVTNCADPTDGFVDNMTTYICGYSDDQYTGNKRAICPYIFNGGTYPYNSIYNCSPHNGAPINTGLIFLIFAGAGAGYYTLKKDKSGKVDDATQL